MEKQITAVYKLHGRAHADEFELERIISGALSTGLAKANNQLEAEATGLKLELHSIDFPKVKA